MLLLLAAGCTPENEFFARPFESIVCSKARRAQSAEVASSLSCSRRRSINSRSISTPGFQRRASKRWTRAPSRSPRSIACSAALRARVQMGSGVSVVSSS